jgi:hypothetical protein
LEYFADIGYISDSELVYICTLLGSSVREVDRCQLAVTGRVSRRLRGASQIGRTAIQGLLDGFIRRIFFHIVNLFIVHPTLSSLNRKHTGLFIHIY